VVVVVVASAALNRDSVGVVGMEGVVDDSSPGRVVESWLLDGCSDPFDGAAVSEDPVLVALPDCAAALVDVVIVGAGVVVSGTVDE
jgi:hypothetical protein